MPDPENDLEDKTEIETEDPEVKVTPGKDPPKDGREWIPRTRFNEATGKLSSRVDALSADLQREREDRIRLEERLRVPTPPSKPKITRAQLREKVSAGEITEDQADELYERDLQERIRQEVAATASTSQRLATVKGLIAQYKEAIPDIAKPGSEARGKVETEYRYLVDVLGEPEGIDTEAKACRSAFGPPERVKELTRERRETHRESGGGGAGNEAPKTAKKLDDRMKAHYEKMIRIGQFKGWDDPRLKAELEFIPSRST